MGKCEQRLVPVGLVSSPEPEDDDRQYHTSLDASLAEVAGEPTFEPTTPPEALHAVARRCGNPPWTAASTGRNATVRDDSPRAATTLGYLAVRSFEGSNPFASTRKSW